MRYSCLNNRLDFLRVATRLTTPQFSSWRLPLITVFVMGYLLWPTIAQENSSQKAADYIYYDRIAEMRMSTSPGPFDAAIRHSVMIPTDKALQILKLVGEAKPVAWPDDIVLWQESMIMTVKHENTENKLQKNKLQRVSVFMRIQSRSPHLIVIGLRCFMIANKPDEQLLCEAIYDIAKFRDVIEP